jgi:hypothetical protein
VSYADRLQRGHDYVAYFPLPQQILRTQYSKRARAAQRLPNNASVAKSKIDLKSWSTSLLYAVSMPTKPDPAILQAAFGELEGRQARLDIHIRDLRSMLGGIPNLQRTKVPRRKRTLSAEARARIAEAQRQR